MLTTVQGEKLMIKQNGKSAMITDENGGTAKVTIADVNQSSGVIHVVDKVLLPNNIMCKYYVYPKSRQLPAFLLIKIVEYFL